MAVGEHALGARGQPRLGPLEGVADRPPSPTNTATGPSRAARWSTADNTSGFGRGGSPAPRRRPTPVPRRGECLIYSLDKGPDLGGIRRQPGGPPRRPRSSAPLACPDEAVGHGHLRRGGRSSRLRVPFLARPEGLDLSRVGSPASSSAPTSSSCPSTGVLRPDVLGALGGRRGIPARPVRWQVVHGPSRAASGGPGTATFTPRRPSATSRKGRRIQVGWAQGIDSPRPSPSTSR